MESVSNMAQAAAKAVWGTSESKEEPVSGKTGNTAKGEPYDAGNMEPRATTGVTGTDTVQPTEFSSTTGADDDTTSGDNYTTSGDNFRSGSGNDYLPTRDSEFNKPASDFTTGNTDKKTTENTTSSDTAAIGSTYLPSRNKEYKSGNDNTSTSDSNFKSTGDDRDYTLGETRETTGSSYLPTRDNEYNKPTSDFTTGSTDKNTTDTTTTGSTYLPLDDYKSGSGYKSANESNFKSTGNDEDYTLGETRETTGSSYLPTRDHDYKSTSDNNTTTSTHDTTSSSSGPHKVFGSSVKPNQDMSKAQQDVRDPSDPQTDPNNAAMKSNVDDSTGGPDMGDNPDKIHGTGPKPIEEVAKKFGGDAGDAKPETRGTEDEEGGDGPQKTSQGSGTGEQYVKSSGLKADGGDFDATKPGAGREADRLLEEKGVHREPAKPSATVDDGAHDATGHEGKEKKSLGEKIKAHMHKPHLKH
jgi:hypothetical protein